jgi:hypothetical protein
MTPEILLQVYAISDRQIHLMNQLLELEFERIMTVPIAFEEVHKSAQLTIAELQDSVERLRKHQNLLRRKILRKESRI